MESERTFFESVRQLFNGLHALLSIEDGLEGYRMNLIMARLLESFGSVEVVRLASHIGAECNIIVDPRVLYIAFTPHQLAKKLAPLVTGGGRRGAAKAL